MPTETYVEEKQIIGDDGEIITVRKKITKTSKTVVVHKSGAYHAEDDEDSHKTTKGGGGGCGCLRAIFCCGCGGKTKEDGEGGGLVSESEAHLIPDRDVKGYERDCLKWHNHYRAMHGTPPLRLNARLTALAQDWANQLAKIGYMEHRDNCDSGENIYNKWSTDPNFNVSGKDPCAQWYSEIKLYSFGREPSNMDAGHFTQLIWRNTREVGIGRSRSSSNKIFVVANYEPAGNVVGQFAANVPPPK